MNEWVSEWLCSKGEVYPKRRCRNYTVSGLQMADEGARQPEGTRNSPWNSFHCRFQGAFNKERGEAVRYKSPRAVWWKKAIFKPFFSVCCRAHLSRITLSGTPGYSPVWKDAALLAFHWSLVAGEAPWRRRQNKSRCWKDFPQALWEALSGLWDGWEEEGVGAVA